MFKKTSKLSLSALILGILFTLLQLYFVVRSVIAGETFGLRLDNCKNFFSDLFYFVRYFASGFLGIIFLMIGLFSKNNSQNKNTSKTKVLCACGILSAVFVALYAIKLPLSQNLRVTFTFIPLAIAGWLFGPVPAALVGFVGDILGCMLFPMGAYFPGFTLSTMLTGLIFGVFLYKADMTSSKSIILIILSKFCVSILVNIVLNSLWLSMMYGSAFYAYLVSHSIKNAIAFPFECILLFLLASTLSKNSIEKMYKTK